jgi:hypothetical protein
LQRSFHISTDVEVKDAKKLKIGPNGANNTFCVINCAGKQFQSKIVNDSLYPHYNE